MACANPYTWQNGKTFNIEPGISYTLNYSNLLTGPISAERRSLKFEDFQLSTFKIRGVLPAETHSSPDENLTFHIFPNIFQLGHQGHEINPNQRFQLTAHPNLPELPEPEIIKDPSSVPLITEEIESVLGRLLVLLKNTATNYSMPSKRIEISGFSDREENTREVVVTQWVNAPAQTAMEYWDQLGIAIENWIRFLPKKLKKVVTENISVDVQWENDHAI